MADMQEYATKADLADVAKAWESRLYTVRGDIIGKIDGVAGQLDNLRSDFVELRSDISEIRVTILQLAARIP